MVIQRKFSEAIPGDNRKYRLAFALYIYTGARRSEIHKLNWSHIKEDYIIFTERKNEEMLNVPIVPKLKEILDAQRKDIGRLFACPYITWEDESSIISGRQD